MITYLQGNILNTPALTIVNTVNTVGVMGKGLALSIKNCYPEMFDTYVQACKTQQLHIGTLLYFSYPDHNILLFPTKVHWKFPSKMQWIEQGLEEFVKVFQEYEISSIAFPMLGCGNGGLQWKDVKPIMESYLSQLPIHSYVYTGIGPTPVEKPKTVHNCAERMASIAQDLEDIALLRRFNEYYMFPYEFDTDEGPSKMSYSVNTITIEYGGKIEHYTDDEFCNRWNKWKQEEIIIASEENTGLLQLLKAMSCIEDVLVEIEDTTKKGYQVLLMNDRAYRNGGSTQ